MSEERGKLQLEGLLSEALRPIEPPEDLAGRVESTLTAITEQAAAQLSSWAEELSEGELQALRDPRNWVRPVAAVAVGTVAGGALVLVGMRSRRRPTGLRATAENVLRQVQINALGSLGASGERSAVRCGGLACRAGIAVSTGDFVASAGHATSRWMSPRQSFCGSCGEAGEAEDQVQDVVLGVHGDDAQDLLAAADDESPDRDHEIERGRVPARTPARRTLRPPGRASRWPGGRRCASR